MDPASQSLKNLPGFLWFFFFMLFKLICHFCAPWPRVWLQDMAFYWNWSKYQNTAPFFTGKAHFFLSSTLKSALWTVQIVVESCRKSQHHHKSINHTNFLWRKPQLGLTQVRSEWYSRPNLKQTKNFTCIIILMLFLQPLPCMVYKHDYLPTRSWSLSEFLEVRDESSKSSSTCQCISLNLHFI